MGKSRMPKTIVDCKNCLNVSDYILYCRRSHHFAVDQEIIPSEPLGESPGVFHSVHRHVAIAGGVHPVHHQLGSHREQRVAPVGCRESFLLIRPGLYNHVQDIADILNPTQRHIQIAFCFVVIKSPNSF